MKIFPIFVGIATIIAAIYAALQFHFGINPEERRSIEAINKYDNNSSSHNDNAYHVIYKSTPIRIPNTILLMKNNIELNISKNIYKSERNWLLVAYNLALEMPDNIRKSYSLFKVSNSALSIDDYNMAIIAASNIPYNIARYYTIMEIVKKASNNYNTLGYALLASDKLQNSSDKANAYMIIINSLSEEEIQQHTVRELLKK